MLALSEKRRASVCALYDDEAPLKGDGLLIYAARTAGYGTPTSSNKSHQGYSRLIVRAISPEAVRGVKNLIRDKNKDHARAVAMVLDRIDPVETSHIVNVGDVRPPSIEATQKVLDRIEKLARRAGLISFVKCR